MGQRSKNRIQEKDIEDNEDMKRGGIAIRNEIFNDSTKTLISYYFITRLLSQNDYFGLPSCHGIESGGN